MVDGANAWQRFRHVTLPMLRPTLFTVLTLGLIGTWQVFDQIYTGTQGGPAKTTLTPAYLSYKTAFNNQNWGQGAAIAFVLFAIIVVSRSAALVLRTGRRERRRRESATDRSGGTVATSAALAEVDRNAGRAPRALALTGGCLDRCWPAGARLHLCRS